MKQLVRCAILLLTKQTGLCACTSTHRQMHAHSRDRHWTHLLQATLDDLGKGLGPALVAALISITGRVPAFNLAISGWVPCGVMFLLAGRTLARDEEAVQWQLSHVAGSALPAHDGFLNTSTLEGLGTPAHSTFTNESHTPRLAARAAIEMGALRSAPDSKQSRHSAAQEDVPLLHD